MLSYTQAQDDTNRSISIDRIEKIIIFNSFYFLPRQEESSSKQQRMENGGGNSGKFLREIEVRDDDLKFIQIRMPWSITIGWCKDCWKRDESGAVAWNKLNASRAEWKGRRNARVTGWSRCPCVFQTPLLELEWEYPPGPCTRPPYFGQTFAPIG